MEDPKFFLRTNGIFYWAQGTGIVSHVKRITFEGDLLKFAVVLSYVRMEGAFQMGQKFGLVLELISPFLGFLLFH